MSEDFLTSVIIQEFHNLFNVIYSDEMYPNMVHYSDAKTLFKKSGITLKHPGTGFSLRHRDGLNMEMDMHDFSSTWLNAYIIDNGGEGYQLFPVGFAQGSHPKAYQGALSRYSERFAAELEEKQFTPQQADRAAVELFLSDEVVRVDDDREPGTEGEYSLDGHPGEGLFRVDKSVEAINMRDFETRNGYITLDPVSDDAFEDSGEEDEDKVPPPSKEPFYYVIRIEFRGRKLSKLPKAWRKKIIEDGLSWSFADGLLCVSNTIGTSYGYPPAPKHIVGLPRLPLVDLSEWDGPTPAEDRKEEDGAQVVAPSRPRVAKSAAAWIHIVEDFMSDPCWTTFENFRDAEEINIAYNRHKEDPGYKMGTNKRPLAMQVRKLMTGEENAKTWTEFTEILHDTAGPKNDSKGIMILLFKMRLHLQETQGKVYSMAQY